MRLSSVCWVESFCPSNLLYIIIICSSCVHFHCINGSLLHIYPDNTLWCAASIIACPFLSWLWWLSPSTFSSDYGQHTRCVSFNYLKCLTADCTCCIVPSPAEVKLLDLELTRLFSSCVGTQHSKWTGIEPKMQQGATAENNPFLFSVL